MSNQENISQEPPRKRRNRWGDDENTTVSASVATTAASIDTPAASTTDQCIICEVKPRKTRFGESVATEGSALTTESLQARLALELQLQRVNLGLSTVVADAVQRDKDPNRSPSPPPRYDGEGKRINTREYCMRESLNLERISVIEQLIRLDPAYKPPSDYVRQKPFKKVFIPTEDNYNYIGLIIGPRGNTQKKMETETGCRISIRGKGAAKEGSKARSQRTADDELDLHVHITGDTVESVNSAVKLVEALLVPVEDSQNTHKINQLRELALINGTLREEDHCILCGEKGHNQYDCPLKVKSFKMASVKCAICGDLSHPTRDCPVKNSGETGNNSEILDNEYDNFMAELIGKKESKKETEGDSSSADSSENLSSGSKPSVIAPIVDIFNLKSTSETPAVEIAPLPTITLSLSSATIGLPITPALTTNSTTVPPLSTSSTSTALPHSSSGNQSYTSSGFCPATEAYITSAAAAAAAPYANSPQYNHYYSYYYTYYATHAQALQSQSQGLSTK